MHIELSSTCLLMCMIPQIQTTDKLKEPKFIFAVFCGERFNYNDDPGFPQDDNHFLNH